MSDSRETLVFPVHSDNFQMQVATTETLASQASEFQQIDIIDTVDFGRVLLLDGHIQLATRDEHAYHETLVHIPLLSVPEPTSALVVGGGDGGVLREIVRHPSLKRIDMVEIDQMVVDLSRQFLPGVSAGAFDDPRVELRIEDAFAFVKNSGRTYDLIVVDATDTYEDEEGELSEMLFTEEFYRDCKNALTDDGFVVTQCDNPVFCGYSLAQVRPFFSGIFDASGDYWTLVPSFGGYSACIWGSKGNVVSPTYPAERAARLSGLKYLDELTYRLAMSPVPFSG